MKIILFFLLTMAPLAANPDRVVLKPGKVLEFPKLKISKASEFYQSWTGRKVVAVLR